MFLFITKVVSYQETIKVVKEEKEALEYIRQLYILVIKIQLHQYQSGRYLSGNSTKDSLEPLKKTRAEINELFEKSLKLDERHFAKFEGHDDGLTDSKKAWSSLIKRLNDKRI